MLRHRALWRVRDPPPARRRAALCLLVVARSWVAKLRIDVEMANDLRACRRTPIMKQRTIRKSPLSQCGTPGCVMNAHHFGSCRWSDSYLRIMMDEVSINNRNEDDEEEKMHKEHEEEDKMRSSSNEN